MSNNLRTIAGEYTPDSLIADISFPVQTGGVTLKAAQGVLLRGTVVGKNVEGVFVPASKTASVEPYGILADDVDTTGAKNINSVVYLSGSFNGGALIFGGEDTVDTHKEVLRDKGIYLKIVL